MISRLAHLRDPERMAAGRAWAGARQITPGPTQTFQIQDVPTHSLDDGLTRQMAAGSDYTPAHYVDTPQVAVRPANLGSYFVSNPAIFQSYFKVHWEDMFGMSADLKEGARTLTPNRNPNAPGRAEGQALQPYNPWPSASQLTAAYPGAELKAI